MTSSTNYSEYNMGSNIDRLQLLQTYKADDIQFFIQNRHSDIIPENMQTYILQMDSAATLMRTNRLSVREAVEKIRLQWPQLSFSQARSIYYDALDYFYMDDSVSARSWDLVYAEKFEDMALLAIKANKLEVAYKCSAKAHELRTKQRESMEIDWHAPTYMININVKPEDLGFASQKLADIAKRNEDRKYREMIMSLEVTDAEKQRLLREAGVADSANQDQQPDEQ